MKVIVNEFISLDGVVQAPGGPEEDTDGGFAHGGWSHTYFDVPKMSPVIGGGPDPPGGTRFAPTRPGPAAAPGGWRPPPGPSAAATPSPTRSIPARSTSPRGRSRPRT